MDDLQKAKDTIEAAQVLAAAAKLKQQQNCPSRQGMIDALMAAWNAAPVEIATIEQGTAMDMPSFLASLPNNMLYSRLPLYFQCLHNFCSKKALVDVISYFAKNYSN